jgi:hypothetical protein
LRGDGLLGDNSVAGKSRGCWRVETIFITCRKSSMRC